MSKKVRLQGYISQELKDKFTATAKEHRRSESNMLIEVLEIYYKNKPDLGQYQHPAGNKKIR